MQPIAKHVLTVAWAVFFCLVFFLLSSCSSLSPEEVKQQSGFYYGFGSGTTISEAAAEAKRDLISNALTETARNRGSRKGRIKVDAEAAMAFKLPKLSPIAKEKGSGQETVVVSIKAAEWDKYERAREIAIRTELQKRLEALMDGYGQPLADRMMEAAGMLDRLAREGLTDLLAETEQDSLLMSTAIESFCREASTGISITTNPGSGFIGNETRFEATVLGGDGAPAGSLPLRVQWSAKGAQPATLTVTSGPDGKLTLAYPAGESFRNTGVRLSVSTDFARAAPSSAALKDIDAGTRVDASFRHFDDAGKFFSGEVLVPGGPFAAGALARDKRASRKEAPRQADTPDFCIDLYLVTNALYEMYLEDTKDKNLPEYWDNPQYNQPDQPVIGISYDEAVRFAAWLSAQLGVVKRLPTEDEWEKAARGGLDVIYPWGDQSPTDGVRANYNGNGRFRSTSPVGSFEAGKNAYGMFDMAGNVWEWTSSGRGSGSLIVKGGSWMDGPADLRVSNRREVDPSKGYVDVGFRLVREVSNVE
jgi:hypothetical protein